MITIENVLLPNLSRVTIHHEYHKTIVVDGSQLLALPGMIDAHVHFRNPGYSELEDWKHAVKAALLGGVTTVLDMPNSQPPTNSKVRLEHKIALIQQQLAHAKLPLRFGLYFGVNHHHLDEIAHVRKQVVGIKVFMGSDKHPLVIHEESILHSIYALAKAHHLLIALHTEDRKLVNERMQGMDMNDYASISKISSPEIAAKAVKVAIEMCEIYDVPTYLLHVSSALDIQLIKVAKGKGLPVFAETCPQYLFFDELAYNYLRGRGKFNPPLRKTEDINALWKALRDGTIDVVASDHVPQPELLKKLPLKDCPSGAPGVQTLLPLMLTAWHEGRISLDKVIDLMHSQPKKIFHLKDNEDLVLVNIERYRIVTDNDMKYKCGWTPFAGFRLTGFPEYVYLEGQWIDCKKLNARI
jgi:dihydroorotase